jgi:hypothetical protein
MIGPQLHHGAALHDELGAVIGSTQRPTLMVRELGLDHVGRHVHALHHESARHRAEPMHRHFGGREHHAAQRCADDVLAHRALARQQAGEDVLAMMLAMICDRVEIPQHDQRLLSQEREVQPTVDLLRFEALYVRRRDGPHGVLEVDISSGHLPDVPRPMEAQCREQQHRAHGRLPGVSGDEAHQFAHLPTALAPQPYA